VIPHHRHHQPTVHRHGHTWLADGPGVTRSSRRASDPLKLRPRGPAGSVGQRGRGPRV